VLSTINQERIKPTGIPNYVTLDLLMPSLAATFTDNLLYKSGWRDVITRTDLLFLARSRGRSGFVLGGKRDAPAGVVKAEGLSRLFFRRSAKFSVMPSFLPCEHSILIPAIVW